MQRASMQSQVDAREFYREPEAMYFRIERGQISTTHSISAGLDYPSIGPEHAHLHDEGRVQYVSVTDEEALEAFQTLSHLEGIIPALESAHAVAFAMEEARAMKR